MIRKPVSVGDEFAGDYVPERGINYDLYEPGLLESVLIFSIGGGLSAGAAFLFYNHLWAALCFSAGALPIRVLYCRYRAEKRRWQLREQFRDLLYSLSASTASGRQLDHALEEARENLRLIYPEKALICMELRRMTLEVRESRVPVDQVLVSFGKRSRIEEILRFSRVCSLCRRMGGDMPRVIGRTADLLVEGIDLRRELRVLTAQKRMESVLLTLMPLMVLLFLRLTAFDYLSVMYETLLGRICMTGALIGLTAAGLWSLWLTGDKG